MENTTFENLRAMVADVMAKKNVKDFEIILSGNSKLGDGYMGEIIFFKVICRQSGVNYHLIMKAAGKNEIFREVTLLKSVFDREAFMYTTVFHAVRTYFQTKNYTVLDNIPKFYGYSGEILKEAFVFEDLKQQGYCMWPRGQIVDLNNTILVLKNLAKCHGTFMAYKDQNPEQFRKWIPQLDDVRYNIVERVGLMKHAHTIYEEVLNLLEEKGEHRLVMKYNKYKGKLDQLFQPAPLDDRLVIVHGDCWINNVLFKFETNEEASSECKLIDFQQSFVNTPVDDLSFFIYTSCDETVLDKIDDLLHVYYSTLFETVEFLGSNLNEIFTFKQLQEHWKKYAILGVVTSMEIVKLQNLTEDEVPDFRTICDI